MPVLVEALGEERVNEVLAKYGITDEKEKGFVFLFLNQADDVLEQMEVSLAQVSSSIEVKAANMFKASLELLVALIHKKLDERSAPKH